MAVLKYYNTATSAWEYIAASTTANFTTWKKTMAGGETSVSGTDDNSVTLSYTVGLEQVFINGVLQVRGTDYVATTGTSITGLTALVASDIVTVVCYAPFNVANTIAPTVVDAKGDLIAGTAADTVGRLAVGVDTAFLRPDSTASTGLKWDNDAWTSYTPTWTGITSTGGTSTGAYKQIGKTVFWRAKYVVGSSGISITGAITPSLPTSKNGSLSLANAWFLDSGRGFHTPVVVDVTLYADLASGTYTDAATPSNTVPWTWAVNDEVNISGVYEVS